MDSGNGNPGRDEPRPGYAPLKAFIPVELKYLIRTYQDHNRYPSFTWAVRHLLETHPALASLAAELYTKGNREPGRPSESDIS